MPFQEVIHSIEQLDNLGYKEIVLSGIHLGLYGKDLPKKTSLFNLLSCITESKIKPRIRLSSIEPCELTDDIIDLMQSNQNICNHFHIPLQSGDDNILKKMNRPYTNLFFKELVLKINKYMPDTAIGADVLIGFPGETDEAFENTYSLIKKLPISYLHVFPFSPRKKTPAMKYKNQIPAHIIKKRCHLMRQLGNIKKNDFYNKFIDRSLEVFIEKQYEKKTGFLKGITSNYIPVFIEGDNKLKNKNVLADILKVSSNNAVYGVIKKQDL